jgi:glucan phosphoethanolaminetransferase (alkaline phosphatase superfamily)
MSWEYLALGVVAVLVILMVTFRKNPIVKLYWKYTLIIIPMVVLIILKIIMDAKNKTTTGTTNPTKPDPLAVKIQDIKEELVEAQMTTAIEVSAAKAKSNETLKKLEEVTKITDKAERRRQIAAMVG